MGCATTIKCSELYINTSMTENISPTVYPAPIRKIQSACKRKCPHCNGVATKIAQVGEFSSLTCNKKSCKDAACNCVGRQVKKSETEDAVTRAERINRQRRNAEIRKAAGLNIQELATKI